jgi:hypothetical protein
MRNAALLVVAVFVIAVPHEAAAQERLVIRPLPAPPATSATSTATGATGATGQTIPALDLGDDPVAAAKRLGDALTARLRPLEARMKDDARLRSAGALIGLAAIAAGALHGDAPLTFVGTAAIRAGLERQLNAVRSRTGFTVSPSLGNRSIAVVVSRSFP